MRSIARRTALIPVVVVSALAVAVAIRGNARKSNPAESPGTADRVGPANVQTTVATRPEPQQSPMPSLFLQSVTRDGIAVEFSIQHIDASKADVKELQEGDDARIRFTITDTASRRPVRSLNPAAWMDLIPKNEIRGAKTCEQKIKAFLGGSIFGRAELDLNVYNVLTLNDEASISVVDPLFSFGGTKLLDMVVLESPGEDWALTSNESRLYVSLPETKKVAVVDTAGWTVVRNIELDRRPGRIALQPDESVLWVADDEGTAGERELSGVTAIETNKLERVARINTGHGHHELAFSDDGRRAFVTNAGDDTVSIVDTRSLKKEADVLTGAGPTSIAFSPLAKMAYVSAGDGTITVVDGGRRTVVTRIKAEPGLTQIRFAQDGRLGFVVNSTKDMVHIVDAATNRIVQTADVEDEPYEVAFSAEFAYVRHRGSENVLMMPLKAVGIEKQAVQVFSFPNGKIGPTKTPRLSLPNTIVQAPGENAVLVANPMDKSVSYYREGMAAPVGNFSNYGRQPRAVLVVDHSLRERGSPGVYESVVRLRKPGDYDVVFFLNSPRIVNCFSVTVIPNQALESKRRAGKIKIEHLVEQRRVRVGANVALRFRLTDEQSKAPISGLTDVEVLTTLTQGTWHKRHLATPKDDGVYLLDFAPPPQAFTISISSASRTGWGSTMINTWSWRRRIKMKGISKFDLTLIILGSSSLLILVQGCQNSRTSEAGVAQQAAAAIVPNTLTTLEPKGKAEQECCKTDAPAAPSTVPQPSKLEIESRALTFPDVTLINQDGQPVNVARDLAQGKLLVMNFIFTTCKGVCPPMGVNFGQLQGRIADRLGRDVTLVSVSVDPVTDTPERLKSWGKQFGASTGWTLLTGQKQDVDHFLKALGVFAANKTEHSPFILIGRASEGRWQRIHGLTPAEKLSEVIIDLLGSSDRPQSRPTLALEKDKGKQVGAAPSAAQSYFTDVPLIDQHGKVMRLYSDILKGKVVVITPFFSTCRGSCPKLLDTFAKLQDHYEERLGKDLFLISITVDPDTDTPDKLKAYAEQYHARPGWYFLTGDNNNHQQALTKLGQRVAAKEDHSNVFIIGNDSTGLWKKAMGLAPPAEIIRIVDTVLNDKPS